MNFLVTAYRFAATKPLKKLIKSYAYRLSGPAYFLAPLLILEVVC